MEAKQEEQKEVLQAVATLKYARISSRKVKIVADLIRGKKCRRSFSYSKIHSKGFISNN